MLRTYLGTVHVHGHVPPSRADLSESSDEDGGPEGLMSSRPSVNLRPRPRPEKSKLLENLEKKILTYAAESKFSSQHSLIICWPAVEPEQGS